MGDSFTVPQWLHLGKASAVALTGKAKASNRKLTVDISSNKYTQKNK